MKRFLVLIMVFISVFVLASCSKKKSHDYKEQVSKEIKADEGGTVESSDGKTSVDIPAGALDEDTKITMTIYDASGYSDEKGKIVSKVVDFEPTGTIFKKPVIITMATDEKVEKKTISAAVYDEKEEKWSYSQGFYLIIKDGKNEGGDPIMQTTDGKEVSLDNGNLTAGGDPIMMTNAAGDPIMTNAAGDPIMMSAAGDPIMLASSNAAGDPIMTSAAGDPIMTSAAGDPIMTSAAGDPIMMTTGHFTTFTFIATDPRKEKPGEAVEEPDDDEPLNDEDETPDEVKDEDETPDETEDEDIIIPEPEKVYSKVLCTGMTICTDYGNQILCPKEGEDFYGQDAQYVARKGCIPHSYTAIPKPEGDETDYYRVKDSVTGLTWLITGEYATYAEKDTACAGISYGDTEWRIPTPKEFLSIVDSEYAIDPLYFNSLFDIQAEGGHPYVWTDTAYMYYDYMYGMIRTATEDEKVYLDQSYGDLICVSGEKYGEVNSEDYETLSVGSDYIVHDKSTGLFWQKDSVSGKSWIKALEYCENLDYAGYTDWRLPNKNELITLLDYSKTGEILSSFPDIQLEVLWSSTSNIDTAWFVITDGNIDMWYGDLPQWEPCDYEGCEYEVHYGINTRCVRSDLDEKEEIPACDGTGIGPCRDAKGTIWSSRLYPEIFAGYPHFFSSGYVDGIAEMCRYLNENGSNQWRLPTIDEIRSIVTTDKLKTNGSCGITDSNFDDSYFDEEACSGDKPSKTILNDYGTMVSGTLQQEESSSRFYLWAVNTANGTLEKNDDFYEYALVQRCVLDKSLNYEKTPYLDENGLLWSDISSDWEWVYTGKYYCDELSRTDSEHYWRLPTMDELSSLVQNDECMEEDDCPVNLNGKYSLFGDISSLLSGEYIGDESYYYIDFSELFYSFDKDGMERIRCVSDSPSPCKNNPCAVVQHSDGCISTSATEYECSCEYGYFLEDSLCVNPCDADPCAGVQHSDGCISKSASRYLCSCETDYFWTGESECREKVVFPYTDESELTWSSLSANIKNWDDAEYYCEHLEEGGFSDWRLPTIDELRTLILNCEGTQTGGACPVSDPDNLEFTNDAACSCDTIDNNGGYYSRFGDGNYVILWSSSPLETSNNYKWLVDFTNAKVYSENETEINGIRCVRKAE